MGQQVALERARVREAQTTHDARERLLAGVSAHVRAEVAGHGECALADRAAPRPVPEVHGAFVTAQTGSAIEAHRAPVAAVRPLAAVRAHVHLEPAERAKRARTVRAGIGACARVYAGVERQQRRVLEATSALRAHVRGHVRVRALVVGARAVLGEAARAAVDAADVRPLAGVSADVCGQRGRRAELPPALAAHARPLIARPTATGRCGARRYCGGRGGAVNLGVRATLVHRQQRRKRESGSAHDTNVTAARRLTTVALSGSTRLTRVRPLVSH